MSRKLKINNFGNEILHIGTENNKKENSKIKEIVQIEIDSIKEMEDSAPDKDSKVEGDDENKPLIINNKLIKIFNNINENIDNNKNKNIEEIYDNYLNKKKNKKTIKINISKCVFLSCFLL